MRNPLAQATGPSSDQTDARGGTDCQKHPARAGRRTAPAADTDRLPASTCEGRDLRVPFRVYIYIYIYDGTIATLHTPRMKRRQGEGIGA